jgi:hypothetical protein
MKQVTQRTLIRGSQRGADMASVARIMSWCLLVIHSVVDLLVSRLSGAVRRSPGLTALACITAGQSLSAKHRLPLERSADMPGRPLTRGLESSSLHRKGPAGTSLWDLRSEFSQVSQRSDTQHRAGCCARAHRRSARLLQANWSSTLTQRRRHLHHRGAPDLRRSYGRPSSRTPARQSAPKEHATTPGPKAVTSR